MKYQILSASALLLVQGKIGKHQLEVAQNLQSQKDLLGATKNLWQISMSPEADAE